MGNSDLSNAAEDFLKAALELERSEGRATTNELARRLHVSAPTATAMAKRLDAQGLVTRTPYRGVTLTDRGRLVALEVLRHHRLLERYLVESLGVPLEEVHVEADRLEHVMSEELEERIDAALGFPTHDPHGDPIPDRELRLVEREPGRTLATLGQGECSGRDPRARRRRRRPALSDPPRPRTGYLDRGRASGSLRRAGHGAGGRRRTMRSRATSRRRSASSDPAGRRYGVETSGDALRARALTIGTACGKFVPIATLSPLGDMRCLAPGSARAGARGRNACKPAPFTRRRPEVFPRLLHRRSRSIPSGGQVGGQLLERRDEPVAVLEASG